MGLPALDIPEEWFYHQQSKTLYFIAPDGKQPERGKARGKRRDFAISIGRLRFLGLNDNDLLWLIRKGFVCHGLETTVSGDSSRHFRDGPRLGFLSQSSFIISDLG